MSTSIMSTFAKDWSTPRSLRSFTGFVAKNQTPAGTVLHCMANMPIPACLEEYQKRPKTHISVTVVGIKNLGYTYAPWKKSNKGGKPEGTKKLFEENETLVHEHERVYGSCKMFSFARDGKADKGARIDEPYTVIQLGQTFHMALADYMYEKKTKGESIFEEGEKLIEAFTLIEMVINPTASENTEKGYGMTLGMIRRLPFTMNSYMTPVNIQALLGEYDALQAKALTQQKESALAIRMQLETTNLGYLAKCAPGTFLGESPVEGMCRLQVADGGSVVPGVLMVDVCKGDMLGLFNAGEIWLCTRDFITKSNFFKKTGDDLAYVQMLVDLASAAGCLYCWVYRNEYFMRGEKDNCEFRGFPIVPSDQLLDFVDVNLESGEDKTKIAFPFELDSAPPLHVTIKHVPEPNGGEFPLTCPDFVLSSSKVSVERAYHMMIGCDENPEIMPIMFRSEPKAGMKRGGGRLNWASYKRD